MAEKYDIQLVDGDLPEITQHVTGILLTMQRVKIRLETALGDWFLDTSVGIDYLGLSDISPAPVEAFSAILRAETLDTPGVTAIISWVTTFDKPSQKISIEAVVETEDGLMQTTLTSSPALGTGNTWYLWPIAFTLL